MHLTTFISRPSANGEIKNAISITVDFLPEENCANEVIAVMAHGFNPSKSVDVTDIFVMDITAGLDKLIEGVDWMELYREEKRKAA